MLDVAIGDYHYNNYPISRIDQSDSFQFETPSATTTYTNSPVVKQEYFDIMTPEYHIDEGDIEPGHAATWPPAQTDLIPPNAPGGLVPTQQQGQRKPNMSLLYPTFDQSQPLRNSPLPLQEGPAEDQNTSTSHPTSFVSSANSFGPYSLYSSSSAIPTSRQSPNPPSSQECLCSVLGQVCTCPRQWNRPRFSQVNESFNSSSSSSTNGMADSYSSSSSSAMTPVYPNRPVYLKRPYSHHPMEAHPMSNGWLPDNGVMQHSFEDSTVPQSSFQHPINNQLSSQMSALQHSPDGSPSMIQGQGPMPYLYEGVASTDTFNAIGSSSASTSPVTEMDIPLPTSNAQGKRAEDQYAIKSGYRSADSGLPYRTSRPSTSNSLTAPTMNHTVSQMSLASSNGHYHPYNLQRPASTVIGLTGYNGYEQQIRADASSSMSPSSSSSKMGAFHDYESSDRFNTEEDRWNAILNRTHSADAFFVYGSLTTRIYCRPSCASKRPDRNRVIFFPYPEAPAKAEYGGYRACKRCKPRTPGTADLCVLAVGQCLRHITQAAILGESEEIDASLKKRTLKEYSSDYGVSAFHFHRTLKSVSTLTPGDYSKACHALVLQDEIGMDRKDGQTLTATELHERLRGWSSRRARRAVGNILPSTYARGFPNMKMYYICATDTRFGKVCILFTKGEDALSNSRDLVVHSLDANDYSNQHCTIMAALIGEDSLVRIQKRAPQAIAVPSQSDWLRSLVEDLDRKGLREVQMPQEVIPWVRRARVWLAVKHAMEPTSRAVGKRSSEGDDEDDDEEGDEDEGNPIKNGV
jgi:methylphosphotriester-DNA--protein-cysteine methyltransferase